MLVYEEPPEKPKPLWPIFVVFGFVVALVVGAAFVFTISAPPNSDPLTGCRTDGEAPAAMVVLIDQSDPFSTTDKESVRAYVHDWARSAPAYSRISIRRINPDDYREPIELWDGCSPGQTENVPVWEAVRSNLTVRERAWNSRMGEPLDEALSTLDREVEADYSPIIESVLELVRDPNLREIPGSKRLVVFSDMIQHTLPSRGGWSAILADPSYSSFRDSPLGRRRFPQVENLEVVLYWIERTPTSSEPGQSARQTSELLGFWDDFFAELTRRDDGVTHDGVPP